MASPGLLLLLLVSSSLFLSTESGNQAIEKYDVEMIKSKSQIAFDVLSKFKDMAVPFLGLIPTHGTLVAVVTNLAAGLILGGESEVINVLKVEFKKLNYKIDKYYEDTKWEIWSAVYSQLESEITVAWGEYIMLLNSLEKAKTVEEKKKFTDAFINKYPESATQKLHVFLTTEGASFMENLAVELGKKIQCYEDDIKEYTGLINSLIYKGITMNHFVYKTKNIEDENRFELSANMAYESEAVMFNMYKSCLLNSDYINEDVKKLIKDPKRRTQMAHGVRLFLAQKYGRYDWMVVAYKTEHSNRPFKVFNQHTLSGFLPVVTSDDVSVAFTRQAKGTHTYPDKVKRAIQRCLYNEVDCHVVADRLSKCMEHVEGVKRDGSDIPVTDAFTAVHAYIDKAHAAVNAKEVPEFYIKPEENTEPYIYTGTCKKYKLLSDLVLPGKFVVLIKSDEEILKKDPCSGLDCGGVQRGKCVRVVDAFVAMCECTKPYYGKNCEESLEEYKKDLRKIDAFTRS